jgi:hypothetical protein
MKKVLSTLAVSAAALAAAGSANANLVITDVSSAYVGAPRAWVEVGSTDYNNVSLSAQSVIGLLDGDPVSLLVYCIELSQTSNEGEFEVVTLLDYLGNDTVRHDRIAALIDDRAGSGNVLTDSAIQLAIWELRYENSAYPLDVTKNHFDTESLTNWAIAGTANTFLAGAAANVGSIDPYLNLFVAKNRHKQDLLFYTRTPPPPPPPPPPVPEPATWAMMIIGFAAVGRAIRSRRATTAVSFS